MQEFKNKIDSRKIKIAIIGGGYVGINLAAIFVRNKFHVTVYDIDSEKIKKLKSGINYIQDEDWIEPIIRTAAKNGLLNASENIENAAENDVILVVVPTAKGKTFEPTDEFIKATCQTIGKKLKPNTLVIVESTVGLGHTENLVKNILEKESNLKAGKDFYLAFSPERIDPGNKVLTIDKISKIVSGIDKTSCDLACYIYSKVVSQVVPVSNCRTAEFVKLMELSQRDALIAHVNELSSLAEKYNIDIEEAIEAAATKWNFVKVKPTIGVGGYCVPPATKSLINSAESSKVNCDLLKAIRKVNDGMSINVAKKVLNTLKNKSNSHVGILGITYKANSTDPRASPVEALINELKKNGINNFIAFDPKCNAIDWIKITKNLDDIFNSDCIVIGTDHNEFKKKDFKDRLLAEAKKRNIKIIDGRNIFKGEKHPNVIGIGR